MSSELPEDREPAHVLSNKSYSLGRDTFIFWPSTPTILLAGLNQRITPVTSATLYRWVHFLGPEYPACELRPVAIKKYDVLKRAITPTGNVILESDSPLPPGDYGWFVPGETYSPCWAPLRDLLQAESFEAQTKRPQSVKYVGDAIKLYTFPPSFEQSVLLRDKRCFITGSLLSQADLGVSWIYPPTWAYKLYQIETPQKFDFDPYISVSNGVLMRKDLIALFHDNAFSIDVDDDHRIVVFRDIDSMNIPVHLPKRESRAGPDDRFLREHFRWSLMVNLVGGDIREDYNHHDVYNAMLELGLSGENDLAHMDDERWDSVLGKEIWEQHMRETLALEVGWEAVRAGDPDIYDPGRDRIEVPECPAYDWYGFLDGFAGEL